MLFGRANPNTVPSGYERCCLAVVDITKLLLPFLRRSGRARWWKERIRRTRARPSRRSGMQWFCSCLHSSWYSSFGGLIRVSCVIFTTTVRAKGKVFVVVKNRCWSVPQPRKKKKRQVNILLQFCCLGTWGYTWIPPYLDTLLEITKYHCGCLRKISNSF